MDKLPEAILEAALHRLENGGNDLLRMHPDYEEQKGAEEMAYAAIRDKLIHEEYDAIEDAWGHLAIHFAVGYALGLADGIATGQAVKTGRNNGLNVKDFMDHVKPKYERFAGGPAELDRVSFLGGACGAIRALAESGIMQTADVDTLEGCLMEYLFNEGANPVKD